MKTKMKVILVLLVVLVSLFLVESYSQNPILDFDIKVTSIENNPTFKLSCTILNRGFKSGEQIRFQINLPDELKIVDQNSSAVFFESFSPLSSKKLEWTCEANEIGSYIVEGNLSIEKSCLTKTIKIRTICQMKIFLEQIRIPSTTDWTGASDVYLQVKIDGNEIRVPETSYISIFGGQIIELNKMLYNGTVIDPPSLEVKIFDEDFLGPESLGSFKANIPLNLDSTWIKTDNEKAEVNLSSKSTIQKVMQYIF